MKEKFLPIGSVVLLKNGTKKIMITGYLPTAKDKPGNVYDYSACIFPEGIISSDQTVVFNHDQINDIISVGYSNEETTSFLEAMNELIKKTNAKQANPEEEQSPEVELPAEAAKEETVEMPAEASVPEEQGVDMNSLPKENPVDPSGMDVIKPFSE